MNNMPKVAVIATFDNSIGVWNCMKQHIDLMTETGASVELYTPCTEKVEFVQQEYKSRLIVFSSRKELKTLVKDKDVDILWYPTTLSLMKYGRLSKRCKIVMWIQGSVADESWLRNKNRIRKGILNAIERYTILKSDGLVYVSDSMRTFYENKYKRVFVNNAVVPCISDFHNYEPKAERKAESYVYIGGLSKWQCFDEIVDIYAKVRTPNSTFHIITLGKEKAEGIVRDKINDAKDVSVYSITDRNKIPEILSTFQYGFLIRQESPVNYVASPIKFLEYLSCGVNVIMTDAVPSYAKIVRDYKVGTIVDINHIDNVAIAPFSPQARKVYLEKFSREQFVSQYEKLIKAVIETE